MRLAGCPVLHKQKDFIFVGFRYAQAVHGDEDMLSGLQQHHLIAVQVLSSAKHKHKRNHFHSRIWYPHVGTVVEFGVDFPLGHL